MAKKKRKKRRKKKLNEGLLQTGNHISGVDRQRGIHFSGTLQAKEDSETTKEWEDDK